MSHGAHTPPRAREGALARVWPRDRAWRELSVAKFCTMESEELPAPACARGEGDVEGAAEGAVEGAGRGRAGGAPVEREQAWRCRGGASDTPGTEEGGLAGGRSSASTSASTSASVRARDGMGRKEHIEYIL